MVRKSSDSLHRPAPAVRRLSASEVQPALDMIAEELRRKGSITLQHFGTFRLVELQPSKRRHPVTGEVVDVPAKRTVRFKPAPALITKVR